MPIAFHLDLHPDQLTSWVKNCTQAVVTVDDQGVVKMVSPQFLKLLQCPLDQVVEQPLDRHLHLPPEEMERLRHPDAHGGLRWVQGELLPFGSSPKTVTLQLISGKSSDGWLHLLLIYSRDQGAHHLQRHAEQIVNSLPQGIVLLDSTLRVTEINPAACWMFGVNRDDLCGQEMKRLFLRLEGGEGSMNWRTGSAAENPSGIFRPPGFWRASPKWLRSITKSRLSPEEKASSPLTISPGIICWT